MEANSLHTHAQGNCREAAVLRDPRLFAKRWQGKGKQAGWRMLHNGLALSPLLFAGGLSHSRPGEPFTDG